MSSFVYDVLRGETPRKSYPPNVSRFRKQGGLIQTVCREYTNYPLGGGEVPTGYSVSPVSGGEYSSMNDEVVQKFHERRARGEIFFNPMSSVTHAYTASNCQYQVTSTSGNPAQTWIGRDGPWFASILPTEVVGSWSAPATDYSVSNADLDRLCTEVSTDVLNDRGRTDVNLFETVAEYQQTVNMFDKPMERLTKWMNSTARDVQMARGSRSVVKTAANAWMAYRYGIRPIISDLSNIWQELRKTELPERITTRARGQIMSSKTTSGVSFLGGIRTTWSNQITDVITVRGMSLDEVYLTTFDRLGFSPKGLITLPWDLVTASFVADWLATFGSYLGALAPSVGWNQLGSTLQVTHVTSNTYVSTGSTWSSGSGYRLDSGISGDVGVVKIAKQRRPLYAPDVVVRSNFRFDKAARIGDAMSLIAQRMKKTF